MGGEYLVENGAHVVARRRLRGAGEVALQIGGECDAGHGPMMHAQALRHQSNASRHDADGGLRCRHPLAQA